MGASGSSESGSQTYLVAPLFLTMAGMIVAIPVICLVINCLHKRRVRQAASSSQSSPRTAAPGFQRIPVSWQKLFKRHSREEWLNLATLQKKSPAPGKQVDIEMGGLDKVRLAARNNVRGRATPKRGASRSSTALPKNLDDGTKNSRIPLAYGNLQTPNGELGRSESQKTYNSTATTITPDFNRSASTRSIASRRLPSISPDEDGYYRPTLASSPLTSSKSTSKPKTKCHLDKSSYAKAESPPDLSRVASLSVKEVSSWDVDKAGEATDKSNGRDATNPRTTHKQNEKRQESLSTTFGDDLKRSNSSTDKSEGPSSASSAMLKGKGKPKQRNQNPKQKQNQNQNQSHGQKPKQEQKDPQKENQNQKQDITEVFNLQRQQSKARMQRELDEILGPPSFSGTGAEAGTAPGSAPGTGSRSAEANPGVQSVDDGDEDLAFSQAEMHGHGYGVVGQDFA